MSYDNWKINTVNSTSCLHQAKTSSSVSSSVQSFNQLFSQGTFLPLKRFKWLNIRSLSIVYVFMCIYFCLFVVYDKIIRSWANIFLYYKIECCGYPSFSPHHFCQVECYIILTVFCCFSEGTKSSSTTLKHINPTETRGSTPIHITLLGENITSTTKWEFSER